MQKKFWFSKARNFYRSPVKLWMTTSSSKRLFADILSRKNKRALVRLFQNGVVSIKSCSLAGFCPDSQNIHSDAAKISIISEHSKFFETFLQKKQDIECNYRTATWF